MEKIICAAVRIQMPDSDEDKVWMGHRHPHAIAAMNDEMTYNYTRRQIIDMGKEQGFITSTGRFVGRREAYAIAREAGQLLHNPVAGECELYSEDIY